MTKILARYQTNICKETKQLPSREVELYGPGELVESLTWKIPWMEEPGGLPSHVKGQIRLSDFTFTFHFHALEKEMATHSSVLAWKIPGTVEPGALLSMGSHGVGHD